MADDRIAPREGSLDAPTRHPLDWKNPQFFDQAALDAELERVFETLPVRALGSGNTFGFNKLSLPGGSSTADYQAFEGDEKAAQAFAGVSARASASVTAALMARASGAGQSSSWSTMKNQRVFTRVWAKVNWAAKPDTSIRNYQ